MSAVADGQLQLPLHSLHLNSGLLQMTLGINSSARGLQ